MTMPDYDLPMPWGKFRGKSISEIPSGYLYWLRDESDAGDDIVEAADAELDFRTRHKTHFYE